MIHIFISLLLLAMFSQIALKMIDFSEQPRCLKCSGRGEHRDDCPWRD